MDDPSEGFATTSGTRVRRLTHAALAVGGVTSLANAVGLVRDVIVARQLTFGVQLDVWVIASTAATLSTSALVSGTAMAIVPAYATMPEGEVRARARFVANVLAVALVGGAGVGVAVSVAAPAIATAIVTPDQRRLTAEALVVLGLLAVASSVVRGVAIALLQARDRFTLGAASAMISSVSVAIVALAVTAPTAQDLALAYGIGLTAEAALLATAATGNAAWARPTRRGMVAVARQLLSAVGMTALTAFLLSLNPMVDLWFAARYDGPGAAGALTLGGRIPIAIAALLATAFATPAFPVIARAAEHGAAAVLAAANRVNRVAVPVSAVALIAIAALSLPFARIAFAGSDVSHPASRQLAMVQISYALSVVPFVGGVIYSRGLQALGRLRQIFLIGVIGFLANVGLDWWWGAWFGLVGLALATSVVYIITMVVMWGMLRSGPDRSGAVPTTDGP